MQITNEPLQCNLESYWQSVQFWELYKHQFETHISCPSSGMIFNARPFLFLLLIYFFGLWISLHCFHLYHSYSTFCSGVAEADFLKNLFQKNRSILHPKWLFGPNFMKLINYGALRKLVGFETYSCKSNPTSVYKGMAKKKGNRQ